MYRDTVTFHSHCIIVHSQDLNDWGFLLPILSYPMQISGQNLKLRHSDPFHYFLSSIHSTLCFEIATSLKNKA